MKHDAPEYIQVKFYTSCQSSSEAVKQSDKCDGLNIEEKVEFQAEIIVDSCPPDPNDWTQTFKISPVGSQEATIIHIEMNCDCPCEHKEHNVSNILVTSAMKFRLISSSAVLFYFVQVL
jgi:protocadherin alpha